MARWRDTDSPTRTLAWAVGIALLVTGYVHVGVWGGVLPAFAPADVAVGALGGLAGGAVLAFAEAHEGLPAATGAWLVLLLTLCVGFVAGAALAPAAALALVVAAWATALGGALLRARTRAGGRT
ncbi:hypothetical protein EFA46_009805 [Halarchaeum sp. CBA1220]|uniref:hypothetical protein n=1 Tax=Halarchaeum sp. CBA1220 TaxID=1853682 RepID=UPI000F3A883C|nr:hypothetical protein [Halarchaeum sp. CBA1220]QLC34487.1 hypothetical protein EFA46_009805 [Halarchaeum sp. CBA1220]